MSDMLGHSYTVGLYTLGCKVSLYETEAVGEEFSRRGFTVLPFDSECDVYVINTCTVTAESDAKSRKYIRRAVRRNPAAVVAVIGCYSQRSAEEVAAIPGVSIVLGTEDKLSVVDRAIALLESGRVPSPLVSVGGLESARFEPMCVERAPRTRAYVKIEDGCECRCSYCAIADARGPVRSKPKDDVIREVEGLSASGTKEIVLTGIETGSYGADFDFEYGLDDLLCELDRRGSAERIRLGSMAPELVGERFISRVGGLRILTPHFHISMQSGSDSVLRSMRRRYSATTAIANMERIREYIPQVNFTADLMVGFPGESEEDFLATVDFVRHTQLLDAHVFAYSKRRGTPAALFENQIAEEVKRERSTRLIAEVALVRDGVLDRIVSAKKPLSCIFESRKGGVYTAHSDGYVEVVAESDEDIRGELKMVVPISHKNGIVYGKIC